MEYMRYSNTPPQACSLIGGNACLKKGSSDDEKEILISNPVNECVVCVQGGPW